MVLATMWAVGMFAVAIGHARAFYLSHNNYHLFPSVLYIVCSFILGYALRSLYRSFKPDI